MIHASKFSGKTIKRVGKKPNRSRGFNIKLLQFGVFLAILILLVGGGVVGYAVLSGLLNLPNQSSYPRSLNGKDRTNILVARLDGEKIAFLSIISFAPETKPFILNIDPAIQISLLQNRGNSQIGDLFRLGNLDRNTGLSDLVLNVSASLAVPIDGYLATDNTGWSSIKQVFGDSLAAQRTYVNSPYFLTWALFGKPHDLYGSLSTWKMISLVRENSDSNPYQVFDLSSTTVSSSDGSLRIDSPSFDNGLGVKFREDLITRVHPRVSVINASGVPGAATEIARYVKNLGGELVTVQTANKNQTHTSIKDHLGGNELSTRLGDFMNVAVSKDSVTSAADVEIVIGEDVKLWF